MSGGFGRVEYALAIDRCRSPCRVVPDVSSAHLVVTQSSQVLSLNFPTHHLTNAGKTRENHGTNTSTIKPTINPVMNGK